MTNNSGENWQPIIDLVSELKLCAEYGITTASIAMAYICIDTLANLARPSNKQKVTRSDFIKWVDKYLKAYSQQSYQYRGKDVYAARCAFLHTFGAKAELHKEDVDIKMFAYNNGGKHQYNPNASPGLVIIGSKSFINDVIIAVDSFLEHCQYDESLKKLVVPRLANVMQIRPCPSP